MNSKIKDEYQIMNIGTTKYYKICLKLNLVEERKVVQMTHIIQTKTTCTYAE